MDSKALVLPAGHAINLAGVALAILVGVLSFEGAGSWTLILVAILAGALGWQLIMAIGGADIPSSSPS